ncbi:MAG: SemiSWEET transporter [Thermoplasmatales archaeon]|nr:SemiSWEET transporter [Thermoplasmatales archaeon]
MNSAIIGLFAATLTTISFIPQVIKTFRLRRAEDISLAMYVLFCTGIFLWLVYGVLIKDFPIILANSITLILSLTILFFKIKYG